MATAMACEKKNGIPMAPPISKPKDCDIKLNAPPEPIRIFVVILDNDRAVERVMATATMIIINAPITPAFPTTHGWRMYIITPKMVRNVGVKTPAIVPNFLIVIGSLDVIFKLSYIAIPIYKKNRSLILLNPNNFKGFCIPIF
jgi:hypothetical protein